MEEQFIPENLKQNLIPTHTRKNSQATCYTKITLSNYRLNQMPLLRIHLLYLSIIIKKIKQSYHLKKKLYLSIFYSKNL